MCLSHSRQVPTCLVDGRHLLQHGERIQCAVVLPHEAVEAPRSWPRVGLCVFVHVDEALETKPNQKAAEQQKSPRPRARGTKGRRGASEGEEHWRWGDSAHVVSRVVAVVRTYRRTGGGRHVMRAPTQSYMGAPLCPP